MIEENKLMKILEPWYFTTREYSMKILKLFRIKISLFAGSR